jgi:hypothetical protein
VSEQEKREGRRDKGREESQMIQKAILVVLVLPDLVTPGELQVLLEPQVTQMHHTVHDSISFLKHQLYRDVIHTT